MELPVDVTLNTSFSCQQKVRILHQLRKAMHDQPHQPCTCKPKDPDEPLYMAEAALERWAAVGCNLDSAAGLPECLDTHLRKVSNKNVNLRATHARSVNLRATHQKVCPAKKIVDDKCCSLPYID